MSSTWVRVRRARDWAPRGLQHSDQSDSVAAGALEPDHHPRARGMLGDPGDRFGKAALVVADHQRGDGCATGRGQFNSVRVAVRVAADDGIDNLCQHGHAASDLHPAIGSVGSAPALSGVTDRHICDRSRARGTDTGTQQGGILSRCCR
jgi:hypothetical protein